MEEQLSHRIETPVVPIIHALADVNDQLSRGRPFFVDIAKDGVVLYEKPGHPLAEPKPLTVEEAHREAASYFEQRYQLSLDALKVADFSISNGIWRDGAFMLHQATERAYHCALLTLTLYSPKSHRIKVLRSQAEAVDSRLIAAWPRDSRFPRRCFELLSRAYFEARYSSKFEISKEELIWLVERVKSLQDLVEAICRERLSL
ncbi:HEPN domain-containing protein [Rhizobium sp. CF122]|nr:HEPN domain-containing protein [Rhizobium sp. CF122]EJL50525.1 HEPN domain-containing protein [Rhizobium sp. CF122]